MLNLKKLLTKLASGAVITSSPLNLVTSEAKTATTTPNGSVNISTPYGINSSNAIPICVYVRSSNHENGITASLINIGSNYWIKCKDASNDNVIASESVSIYLTYLKTRVGGVIPELIHRFKTACTSLRKGVSVC